MPGQSSRWSRINSLMPLSRTRDSVQRRKENKACEPTPEEWCTESYIRGREMDFLALFLFSLGPSIGAGRTMFRDVFRGLFPWYQAQALPYVEVSVYSSSSLSGQKRVGCSAATDSKLQPFRTGTSCPGETSHIDGPIGPKD